MLCVRVETFDFGTWPCALVGSRHGICAATVGLRLILTAASSDFSLWLKVGTCQPDLTQARVLHMRHVLAQINLFWSLLGSLPRVGYRPAEGVIARSLETSLKGPSVVITAEGQAYSMQALACVRTGSRLGRVLAYPCPRYKVPQAFCSYKPTVALVGRS